MNELQTDRNSYRYIVGVWLRAVCVLLLAALLASCGGAGDIANNNVSNDNTAADDNAAVSDDTSAADDDTEPGPTPKPTTPPQDRIEDWIVDLEWPSDIELGESDVIRLKMVPSETGLVIEAEFADHTSTTHTIPIQRPEGYILTAVAELHAVNFDISPEGPQRHELIVGKEETWYWTITPRKDGRQRMSISLMMEWQALGDQQPPTREFGTFSHGFEIQVTSVLGMRRGTAYTLLSLLCLGMLGLTIFTVSRAFRSKILQTNSPNPNVRLEPQPDVVLTGQERYLLQTIFRQYRRVVVEKEFMSGYSGARTFMTIPVHADQKADARTIIKLSDTDSIQREYLNYQRYVKTTLPPTTARIQQKPVTTRNSQLAALRYTFIGMPGETPLSLRQALLENPDPTWFARLADAYGPNWWMQRTPYTFRLGREYDRKLPAHLTLKLARGNGKRVDGRNAPARLDVQVGDLVQLSNFTVKSYNPQLGKYSLVGMGQEGQTPLRVSCFGEHLPARITGKVTATRQSFLAERTAGFEMFGLPDPLTSLPGLLNKTVAGTRSVIHGDLNLENILIGPGETLWLIDFAETREGHTLFDFAHLYVEVVAHILSQHVDGPEVYLKGLEKGYPLLDALGQAASRYLFNPEDNGEFILAVVVSCIGAQKYRNLDDWARHLLYLTSAYLAQKL